MCIDQEEREYAIKSFKEGKKDVLIATDIVSKGLDFPDVQHVINFDMPKEIENYSTRFMDDGSPVQYIELAALVGEAKQGLPLPLSTTINP